MAGAEDDEFDALLIPDPELDAGWEYDVASQKEEEYWDKLDTISAQKKRNELSIHKTIGCIVPVAIGTAFLQFLVVLGVYVAHLILPTGQRWLTADELSHIHNMLFSGVVGGAIAIVARMYLLKD
jgi:hypothetical protein